MSYFRQCPFKFRLNTHILFNKNMASDVIGKCKAWVVEFFVETIEVVWSRMISASGPISWILSKEGFDGEGVWGKVRAYGSICRERTICLRKKMKSSEVGENKRNSCSESESEHTTVDGKKSYTSWCSRYPNIHRVLYIPGGWPWDFWTINSNTTGTAQSSNTTDIHHGFLEAIRDAVMLWNLGMHLAERAWRPRWFLLGFSGFLFVRVMH